MVGGFASQKIASVLCSGLLSDTQPRTRGDPAETAALEREEGGREGDGAMRGEQ